LFLFKVLLVPYSCNADCFHFLEAVMEVEIKQQMVMDADGNMLRNPEPQDHGDKVWGAGTQAPLLAALVDDPPMESRGFGFVTFEAPETKILALKQGVLHKHKAHLRISELDRSEREGRGRGIRTKC
jgi:hypothetical protein